jgi:hypothetical protein
MKQIYTLLLIVLFNIAANAQPITISEINYKSAAPSLDVGDWFELHNFGTTPVDITGWKAADSLNTQVYTFPANTIIAAGDYLAVYRKAAQFSLYFPSVTKKVGPFLFKLDGFDSLKIFDNNNNLVVKAVINSNRYWPDGADGEGRTMELINHNSNAGLTDSTAWRDGCMLGSPASAAVPCNDPIIITEINYNNDSARNIGEFIEFYNTTSSPIDLSNWYFKDGSDSLVNKYDFPSGTVIGPGAYLAVSNDTAALYKYKSRSNTIIGQYNFSLKNSGELIRLYNNNNELRFTIHYRDTIPWTDSADGKGYTLEIKNKLGRTNDPKNYFAGCLGGSPGLPFTPNCKDFYPLAIGYNTMPLANIATDNVNSITITNNTAYHKAVIIDLTGKQVLSTNLSKGNTTINISTLNKGIYIIKVSNGLQTAVQKMVKY